MNEETTEWDCVGGMEQEQDVLKCLGSGFPRFILEPVLETTTGSEWQERVHTAPPVASLVSHSVCYVFRTQLSMKNL